MGIRETLAIDLLIVDEFGMDSHGDLEWATRYVRKCSKDPHEGDCSKAEHQGPWTCSRCQADRYLKWADRIIAMINDQPPPSP